MSPGVNCHQEDERGGRIAYRPPPKPSRASQRHGKDDGNTAVISQPHGAGETTWTGTENRLDIDKGRPNPNRGHFMIGRKLRTRA